MIYYTNTGALLRIKELGMFKGKDVELSIKKSELPFPKAPYKTKALTVF
ncbi:MAG: hypothetical protein PVH88_19450 [Ignavibacteria bacterium]|jgi:hypothetical protein